MATKFITFATLVLSASILMLEISAQSECGGNQAEIEIQCKRFFEKDGPQIPPSEACCEAMKGLDVTCYCNFYVTPEVEDLVSIDKALYVARTCKGQNIPTATCGSFVIAVPPSKA